MNPEKNEVLQLAENIINGNIDLVDGTLLLGRAIRRLDERFRNIDDFILFDGIESEFDTVPIGNNIKNYSSEYLVRKYKEIGSYIYPMKSELLESCTKIIKILKDE